MWQSAQAVHCPQAIQLAIEERAQAAGDGVAGLTAAVVGPPGPRSRGRRARGVTSAVLALISSVENSTRPQTTSEMMSSQCPPL